MRSGSDLACHTKASTAAGNRRRRAEAARQHRYPGIAPRDAAAPQRCPFSCPEVDSASPAVDHRAQQQRIKQHACAGAAARSGSAAAAARVKHQAAIEAHRSTTAVPTAAREVGRVIETAVASMRRARGLPPARMTLGAGAGAATCDAW